MQRIFLLSMVLLGAICCPLVGLFVAVNVFFSASWAFFQGVVTFCYNAQEVSINLKKGEKEVVEKSVWERHQEKLDNKNEKTD